MFRMMAPVEAAAIDVREDGLHARCSGEFTRLVSPRSGFIAAQVLKKQQLPITPSLEEDRCGTVHGR
jgi:hypothetical protein